MTGSAATSINFPNSTEPITRRLVLRNSTTTDFVVKIVASSAKVIVLEAERLIVRANTITTINVTLNYQHLSILDFNCHKVCIYARPLTFSAVHSLREWVLTRGLENAKQRVQSLTVRVVRDFSPRDTVLDLPGDAQAVEATPFGVAGVIHDDCVTAVRMDADTITANPIEALDYPLEKHLLAQAPQPMWTMNNLVGLVFPAKAKQQEPPSSDRAVDQNAY